MSTLMHQKIDLIRRHPFHLAFESINNEHGFVTEKIFQVMNLILNKSLTHLSFAAGIDLLSSFPSLLTSLHLSVPRELVYCSLQQCLASDTLVVESVSWHSTNLLGPRRS